MFLHCKIYFDSFFTGADPTKFFGFELGALTKCETQADRYIVNGKHEAEDLARVLDQFIEKYILCGVRGFIVTLFDTFFVKSINSVF